MLELMVWMLAVYMVLKGIEIIQIGAASTHEGRAWMIANGFLVLTTCIVAAAIFINLAAQQVSNF